MQKNNINQKNDEISLSEVWHNIWTNKITAILVALVVAVFALATVIIINRSTANIESKFNYEFVGIKENSYPDGTPFDYYNLISRDFLLDVQASDSKFENINIEQLVLDDNLNIQLIEHVKNDRIIDSYFSIEMPLKAFKNSTVLAEEFILAIHNQVITTAKLKNNSLKVRDHFNFTNDLYNRNINDLTYLELTKLINVQYNALISRANTSFTTDNNSNNNLEAIQFIELLDDLEFWFVNEVNLELLLDTIRVESYVRNEARAKQIAALELNVINDQILYHEEVITQLSAKHEQLLTNGTTTSESNSLLEAITKSMLEKIQLTFKKDYYDAIISAPTPNFNEDFDNSLIEITETLQLTVNNYNDKYIDYLNSVTKHIRTSDKKEFNVVNKIDVKLALVAIVLVSGFVGVTAALIKAGIVNKTKED